MVLRVMVMILVSFGVDFLGVWDMLGFQIFGGAHLRKATNNSIECKHFFFTISNIVELGVASAANVFRYQTTCLNSVFITR
jgi:hypothetical protein